MRAAPPVAPITSHRITSHHITSRHFTSHCRTHAHADDQGLDRGKDGRLTLLRVRKTVIETHINSFAEHDNAGHIKHKIESNAREDAPTRGPTTSARAAHGYTRMWGEQTQRSSEANNTNNTT